MLLNLAAALDYEGLREAVAEGIPGFPPPPPGGLPDPEEVEEEERRERAEFQAEHERSEAVDADRKYQITPLGSDLVGAHLALQRWLDERPGGRPRPESLVREAVGPLLCGWSGTIIHAIAPEPLALEALEDAVPSLDREGLGKHMERMVRAGLAKPQDESAQVRCALTEWGRAAIGPLVAAVLYERRHDEELTLSPDVFDVEAGFQMALPLLSLPPWLRGSCRLGVLLPGDEPLIAGTTAKVDRGVVVSSSALLDEKPETWVTGDPLDWCETVIDPSAEKLQAGGDTELTEALLGALHERLFGPPPG
jgi:DNA-binding HxlR family transcriptional regulator